MTLKRTRTEINNTNRKYGRSVEQQVAKLTGGERTPGSGAIKNSVKNLEGDVRIQIPDTNRDFVVIECKATSTITPSGDRSYTLKKSVLDQMMREAEISSNTVGLVFLKWKNLPYTDDFVIFSSRHFFRFLEWAKEGARLEHFDIVLEENNGEN